MATMKWHWHISDTTKTGAEKAASGLKRRSAWRREKWFKVRVVKMPPKGKAIRGYYEVQWYGPSHSL